MKNIRSLFLFPGKFPKILFTFLFSVKEITLHNKEFSPAEIGLLIF